jgi:cytidylate kinase
MDNAPHNIVIAIDGPAASGKGSLTKKLAAQLGYDFLDTGSLYRRIALKCIENGVDLDNKDQIIATARDFEAELNDNYDDSALRTDNIGSTASKIAQILDVRAVLVEFQRNFAKNAEKGAVLDGRDIGTIICPDADIKFYVTASVEERAKRRHKELQSRGIDATTSAVLAEMQERDARDAKRLDEHLAPNHKVNIIDTSDMTPSEVLDTAMKIVASFTNPDS